MGQENLSIDHLMNYDDVYYRDLIIAVIAKLQDRIWWINRFKKENRLVTVPFYYSMSGDERFLMDSFVDDIVDKRVELNTDIIPRGHIYLESVTANFGEMANPNVWIRSNLESQTEILKVYSKVVPIPITCSFSLEIQLSSERDVLVAISKLQSILQVYKYLEFDHRGICIKGIMQQPEGIEMTIPRESNMASDNKIAIKYSFEVKSVFPAMDLGDNGSLASMQALLSGKENISAPGVFGTHFFLANKRVQWDNYIRYGDPENPSTDHLNTDPA